MTSGRWPTRPFVRLAALLGGIGTAVGVVVWLVAPRRYTSDTEVLVVEQRRLQLSSAFAALGGQLGLPTGDAGTSPFFVANLLTSRDVLNAVMARAFPDSADPTPPRVLAEVLGRRAALTPDVLDKARRRLSDAIQTRVETRSNVISVSVELSTPQLARDVTRALVEETDIANRRVRRQQATRTREFVEGRVQLATDSLRTAEDAQRVFFERNVQYRQSPALVLEAQRLQRAVDERQGVYQAVSRDLEESLQDEARDVPSLSVVVAPDLPWRKSWPSGLFLVVAGVGTGLLLSVVVTILAMREAAPEPVLAADLLRKSMRVVRGWVRAAA